MGKKISHLMFIVYIIAFALLLNVIFGDLLTDTDKADLLMRHNAYRQKNQIDKDLKWSESLSERASQKARQIVVQGCQYMNPELHFDISHCGENLASASNSSAYPPIPPMIEQWTNETLFASTSKYNHATQVAWKNTVFVGCGYAQSISAPFYCRVLVCQYYPPGNVKGSMYTYPMSECKAKPVRIKQDLRGSCRKLEKNLVCGERSKFLPNSQPESGSDTFLPSSRNSFQPPPPPPSRSTPPTVISTSRQSGDQFTSSIHNRHQSHQCHVKVPVVTLKVPSENPQLIIPPKKPPCQCRQSKT